MQISFSLLSASPRQDWLEVPARLASRAYGVGRVQVRELSALDFDALWSALVISERLRVETRQAADAARTDAALQSAHDQAKQREREAQDAIVAACVVGHDESTFRCDLPRGATHADVSALLSLVGYGSADIQEALSRGIAEKRFTSGAEVAHFYRRCQPDGVFLTTLLLMIYRFQQGELLSAEHFWKDLPSEKNGAAVLPKQRAVEGTA